MESATKVLALLTVGMSLFNFALASDASIASDDMASDSCVNDPGYPNIATVYCRDLGYQVNLITEKDGGQRSICVFPDGSSCSAWRFYEGVCGEAFSFCVRMGYRQIVKTDGKNPFSPHYAVCVDDLMEHGNPADLMGITNRYKEFSESEMPPSKEGPLEESFIPSELPSSFDWRNHNGQNWVTSLKDQGSCGSCWAFSAVGATEARYNIYTNNPDLDLNLSEEYLVSDCLMNNSCCGGWNYNALDFIKTNGIPDEDCLPYDTAFYNKGRCDCFDTQICPVRCPNRGIGFCNHLACSDRCADWESRLVQINDYFWVSDTNRDEMKQMLIEKGPLSACFGYNNFYWDAENIGRCAPAEGYTHCVVIVGYDDEGGYWIIKDSFGSDSGPNGTGYWNMGYGECNIETLLYYLEPVPIDNDNDGYATEEGDCDDNDNSVYPGAPEFCDSKDNNCDGTVDEGFETPGRTTGLVFELDKQTLDWDVESIADRYDVVKGDLQIFRSSGGDFAASLSSCLEDDSIDAQTSDPDDPSLPDEGFYYLVRTQAACKDGTYDSGESSQTGERDSEIGSSSNNCP